MWSHVRGWLALAAVLAVTALTAACHATPGVKAAAVRSSAAAYSAPTGPVVALGDSYTAGALLPLSPVARPSGCLRSTKAYPVLVAHALKAPLVDAACTEAGVKEMTQAQQTYLGGSNPAQFTALAADDRLVLLTIGGDDIGFLNVLKECMALSFTNPWGRPCQGHYTAGGTDQLAASVTAEVPKLDQMLAGIAARAPRAQIVVVGYPDMFPQSGGCWPGVPITNGDVSYLRGIEDKANATLAAAARTAGATFVNTYDLTAGHDFCQPERVRDVEGLLPGSLALPFHPNTRGQQVMASAVLAAIKN